jgi:pimeloyl-ACP methyl ester carboxylesterase
LLLAFSWGCQTTKRARWLPPVIAIPQWSAFAANSGLESAEDAYATAVHLTHRDDASCVDYYYQVATLVWPEVQRQIAVSGVAQGRTAELYQSSLTQLIRNGQHFNRLDPRRGLFVRTTAGCFTVPIQYHGFPWKPQDFDHLIPVGDYETKELNNLYRCPGLGVATIGVHFRRPYESFRRSKQHFAATALLRPVPDGMQSACPFVLELFDPLRISSIVMAGRQVALERDTTAPVAYVLSQADREYITGFLQPGATDEDAGLFMMKPYQPGKIPLVFVHGLLSDPLTWANLANEIEAQPDLLARYQIWGFEYATGGPFLGSAAALRGQLQRVQTQLDPTGSDVALSRMVLVGHSMGGLIAKLQVTQSGNQLWDAVSCQPFQGIITTPATRNQLAESFFFEPSPRIARVVFIGTPHRGSPWAKRPIGRLGSSLVDEPNTMKEEHRQLIRDNRGAFSREFTRGIPSSIDLLESDSPLLHAIDRLPLDPRVQLHSIVGSGYWMLGAGDSDRVVPVGSARMPGVVTERSIDADHVDLHKTPEGVAELLCILRRHMREFDAQFGLRTVR